MTKPIYKPSIFIATPNLGWLRVEHTDNLTRWFLSGKYRLRWYSLTNIRPGYKARNMCHRDFLKDGSYDYMLLLDADTIPPVDVIDRLLARDKDMVSATVQTIKENKDGTPKLIPVAFRWDDSDKEDIGYRACWDKENEGIKEVDIGTLACCLIKRKVLEAVGPGAFTNWHESGWCIEGKSGDFCFSEKVRKAGFRIWNDYGILCDHFKEIPSKMVNKLMLGASNAESD